MSVAVGGGVATLSGRVTSAYKAAQLARAATRVPGVKRLRNELKPLPVSMIDDAIRSEVASAMASDPVFLRYTTYPNRPIHVIVENGRVTLSGNVASDLEKRKLEMIVRTMLTVTDVRNEPRKN